MKTTELEVVASGPSWKEARSLFLSVGRRVSATSRCGDREGPLGTADIGEMEKAYSKGSSPNWQRQIRGPISNRARAREYAHYRYAILPQSTLLVFGHFGRSCFYRFTSRSCRDICCM